MNTLIIEGRVTTSRERYPWAGITGEAATGAQIGQIKKARGIRFRAQSLADDERDFKFKLKLATVSDEDHYGFSFHAFKTPVIVEIPFNDLRQEGWGRPVPLDRTKITGDFLIQTGDSAHYYNYKLQIWGLEFFE
jgi:hypothetical protein